jgi:hypothetical protein
LTTEIELPEALNESLLGVPEFPLPSAYATFALIPDRVVPAAALVEKTTETFAVPNPAMLPNEHVIVAAGAEQRALGLTETALTLVGSFTVIVVCVAVEDPWFTNFATSRP